MVQRPLIPVVVPRIVQGVRPGVLDDASSPPPPSGTYTEANRFAAPARVRLPDAPTRCAGRAAGFPTRGIRRVPDPRTTSRREPEFAALVVSPSGMHHGRVALVV